MDISNAKKEINIWKRKTLRQLHGKKPHDCKVSKTLLSLPSGTTNSEKKLCRELRNLKWWEEDRWRAVTELFLKSDLFIERLHNGGIFLAFGRLRKPDSEACTAMWYWRTTVPFFREQKEFGQSDLHCWSQDFPNAYSLTALHRVARLSRSGNPTVVRT